MVTSRRPPPPSKVQRSTPRQSLGFSPNALRNHSYRHSSFPPPVRTYGKSEVYEIAAVADWIAAWRILHEGA